MDLVRVEYELELITKMIWQPHLPCELVRVYDISPETLTGRTRGACVHIIGAWNGSVSVEGSINITNWITERMLGVKHEDITETDWQGVMRELTNVTGGNVKGLLGHNNILSTPRAWEGEGFKFTIPETPEVLRLYFSCDDQNFIVRLHEGQLDVDDLE